MTWPNIIARDKMIKKCCKLFLAILYVAPIIPRIINSSIAIFLVVILGMLIPYTLAPKEMDPGNQKTTIVVKANSTHIVVTVFSNTFFINVLISLKTEPHTFMDRTAMQKLYRK